MSSPTWHKEPYPTLAKTTLYSRVRGVVRLVAAVLLTLICFVLFALGKGLRALIGARITVHFGIARLWSRAMLMLLDIPHSVKGQPLKNGGVLASNHVSWSDILALRSVTHINFVAKADVRRWPVIGTVAAITDTVFVERRRTEAKRQQVELKERIEAGELLCLFPEGTSTDGLRVLPLKSALMSAVFVEGVRETAYVQPVTVNYTAPPGQPEDFFGWWGTMPFGKHIWDIASRAGRGGAVEVVFHDPIRVSEAADRKSLTYACELAIRGGLAVDIS
ncbi:MAG: lysophospholipid acyltransferase family protein [Pikeienuella sp.]